MLKFRIISGTTAGRRIDQTHLNVVWQHETSQRIQGVPVGGPGIAAVGGVTKFKILAVTLDPDPDRTAANELSLLINGLAGAIYPAVNLQPAIAAVEQHDFA